jgi:hypothetical protein
MEMRDCVKLKLLEAILPPNREWGFQRMAPPTLQEDRARHGDRERSGDNI